MKSRLKKILQTLLGFDNYLFVFSIFIIRTLKWNKKEGDFLHFLKIIPDDGVILDVGANIGVMTVYLARSKTAKIYAIEPIPTNLKALRRIVSYFKLKNVEILDFALGHEKGEIEMVMPVLDKVKMQGLSHVVHESIETFNVGDKFSVEVKTLDEIEPLLSGGKQIHAIKMDVENFEYFVLKGGEQLIKKHRPIIYTELWENENRQKCFNFITDLNYNVKILESNILVDFDEKVHKTQNFFFIPHQ